MFVYECMKCGDKTGAPNVTARESGGGMALHIHVTCKNPECQSHDWYVVLNKRGTKEYE
jgi:hypothetical protein